MSGLEQIWASKTDDELLEAASDLLSYSAEAEQAIRAELRRRGLREPPEVDRFAAAPSSGPDASRPWLAVVALLLTALFIAPFPLFSLLATPAAIVGAILAGMGRIRPARGVALALVIGIVVVSVPMLLSSYGSASDRAYMSAARWLGVFLGGGPMAALTGLGAYLLLNRKLAQE